MINRLYLNLFLAAVTLSAPAAALAQNDEPQRWSLRAGFGGVTMNDESPDGQPFYTGDDEGNAFFAGGEYYLSKRLALTGALYFEQDGLVTDYASGIGLKKVNRLGVQAGAAYYFFPLKWIVQPHVGASLQTNFLNLGRMQGSGTYKAEQGYPGNALRLDWDVRLPALAVSPEIGVDIRILSSLSLSLGWNMRFGLWGHNRSDIRFIDGPLMGQLTTHVNDNFSKSFTIGLKMDFPTRGISSRSWNNLLNILHSIISSKKGVY